MTPDFCFISGSSWRAIGLLLRRGLAWHKPYVRQISKIQSWSRLKGGVWRVLRWVRDGRQGKLLFMYYVPSHNWRKTLQRFKGTVALVRSSMGGKSKNRGRTATGFWHFPELIRHFVYVSRNTAFQRKEAYSLIPHFPSFSSRPADRNTCSEGICVIWAFRNSFPISFKNCPEAIQ